jgi:transcription antitermination factor NusG
LAPLACCGNDAPRWCVAYTQPQAERWADQNLRQLGYATYLPLIAVQRRDNAIRSLKHTVLVPLFPRYLFVANDSPTLWRPIREAPGVASVLTIGDRVQYAPQGVLATLQANEASRRSIVPPGTLYAPGDAVSLSRGALAGHQGVVLTTTPTHARVALVLLGGLRTVTVRLDALIRPTA